MSKPTGDIGYGETPEAEKREGYETIFVIIAGGRSAA